MTNGTEDQSGDGCGRSNHTVQPLCDLESNWAVDLAKNLEEYLLKICSGDISGDNDSHLSVNSAEVFLVSFREAQTQTCFEVLTDFCLTSYWKPLMQAEASSDLSQTKEKEQADRESHVEPKKSRKHAKHFLDSEFGVLRGIDFKNVHTVINFEMPKSASGYVHRIGRTGRAYNTGASVSLVSPDEMKLLKK